MERLYGHFTYLCLLYKKEEDGKIYREAIVGVSLHQVGPGDSIR